MSISSGDSRRAEGPLAAGSSACPENVAGGRACGDDPRLDVFKGYEDEDFSMRSRPQSAKSKRVGWKLGLSAMSVDHQRHLHEHEGNRSQGCTYLRCWRKISSNSLGAFGARSLSSRLFGLAFGGESALRAWAATTLEVQRNVIAELVLFGRFVTSGGSGLWMA